jgi:glycyl-tRNA synthetase beta chain
VADFLLELLSEEIPARMQAGARNELARLFAECTQAAGLSTGPIDVFSTPRRLVLIAREVAGGTDPAREEIKGPRSSAPPQALDGFLRKTGLKREQLEERDGVYFAAVQRPGRSASGILAEAVKRIVADFPWPKAMRWGSGDLRWVRPLHGIVAMLGEDIVPVEIDGIVSGASTLGHRFHHPGAITVAGASDYMEKLRACHVIVDQDERERIVREGAEAVGAAAGLQLIEDGGLVVENAGLTEWPVPLLGRFDADFLDVPREVIVLTMRTNQKYFACMDEAGLLAPAFVCVANVAAEDGGAGIIEGNRRVLAARLADARFFWEQDLKVPLEEQAAKLGGIIFHEELGTVADKVERVAKLARWLVEEGIVKSSPERGGGPAAKRTVEGAHRGTGAEVGPLHHPSPTAPGGPPPRSGEELADLAERAARLAKADLVTGMVGEFPELQGVIGGYLAAAQGEPAPVAEAIRDHYKPAGQGDEVPTAPVTVAVSLADKLDTLVGFFSSRLQPSGSRDPFALRRAAIGVIAMTTDSLLRMGLSAVAEQAYKLFARTDRLETFGFDVPDHIGGVVQSFLLEERQIHSGDQSEEVFFFHPLNFDRPDWREFELAQTEEPVQLGEPMRQLSSDISTYAQFAVVDLGLRAFFADRLKVQQRDAGVRHDLIDAVFALGGEDDLVRLLARVNALQSFVETQEGTNLLTAYKRAANILKRENWDEKRQATDQVRGDGLEAQEAALIEALDRAEPKATAAIENEDFTGAMSALASLRSPIDEFFDHVTVNDPDAAKRERRLNLLMRFRDAVNRVADFSRIEG